MLSFQLKQIITLPSILVVITTLASIFTIFTISFPPLPPLPPPSPSPRQLSLRRQQVSEKLNEWAVFNEKNKELCEWLTQMESKVSQNGDIGIEEMIEKLRKVKSPDRLKGPASSSSH